MMSAHAPAEDLGPGSLIGAYRVVRVLGQGAMGKVYEARNEQIDKRVAIKVLKTQFSTDKEFLRRFLNEARAASRIEHPGIVNIFEFNRLPGGEAYLVMEYLQGESLSALLKRQRKPLPDALHFGRQIAAALMVAHEQGIVHRDLKPANVMLVSDPERTGRLRVKVVDFGIAKLADLDKGGEDVTTRSGALLGTPSYMSPEQCRSAGAVTAQADVYSLGVMLFEMLSGTRPFLDQTAVGVMYKQMNAAPPSLSLSRPDLPAGVHALVSAMLRKEPAERPEMTEVWRVLGELSVEPGVVTPRRTGSWVMAGVLVGSLVFGIGLLWERGRGRDREPPPSGPQRGAAMAPRQPAPAGVAPGVAPARVRWSITSKPPGAEVVEGDRVLGVTPWQDERAPLPEDVTLVVRKRGYESEKLVMHAGRSAERSVTLRRKAAPASSEIRIAPLDPP